MSRTGGKISSLEIGKTKNSDDGIVRVSITGAPIAKITKGLPSSISSDDNRAKDKFGNDKLESAGDQ